MSRCSDHRKPRSALFEVAQRSASRQQTRAQAAADYRKQCAARAAQTRAASPGPASDRRRARAAAGREVCQRQVVGSSNCAAVVQPSTNPGAGPARSRGAPARQRRARARRRRRCGRRQRAAGPLPGLRLQPCSRLVRPCLRFEVPTWCTPVLAFFPANAAAILFRSRFLRSKECPLCGGARRARAARGHGTGRGAAGAWARGRQRGPAAAGFRVLSRTQFVLRSCFLRSTVF